MAFATTSLWMKIAMFCLLLGTLLFAIGFATLDWMNYYWDSLGLWERDYNGKTHPINTAFLKHNNYTDWYRATQVFECLGLLFQVIGLIIVFLYVCMDRMKKRSPLLAFILFCFAAVACMVIGFAIFVAKIKENHSYDIGWSLGLAMAGCVLTGFADLMGLVELCR